MDNKYFKLLELDKILDLLMDKASSELGRNIIKKLNPFSKYDQVKEALEETTEAQSILIKRGHVSMQGIHNIEDMAKRADIGGVLDNASLIKVADTMRATRILSNLLSGDIKVETFGNAENSNKDKEEVTRYPIIQTMAQSLYVHRDVEDAIYNAIVSDIEVSDNASSELRMIRRRILQKNQNIRSKLNSIISSTSYQKYLQDAIISMRGDRFVIPVKAEYRSVISGIIHDQSQSGATLFIEPMSIVEMNNDLRQLKLQETEEIERILAELSGMVGEVARELISNQEILARLDFAFAKGKLSIAMKAVDPILNRDKSFRIVKGRHPLIDKKTVVANTVYLGKDFSLSLIHI